MKIFVLNTLVVEKLRPFSGMEKDALLHRESFKVNIRLNYSY